MTTILIVDDNPDIRDIFTKFLTLEGFSTLSASGGEECLEVLKKNHPDIILLDIMMEPIDGWQTLTLIKNQPEQKDIPVFVVTGKIINDSELQKYGGQFKTYLMKPVTPKQLKEAVEDILKFP
jgi:two-component system, OmpR family, response regulator